MTPDEQNALAYAKAHPSAQVQMLALARLCEKQQERIQELTAQVDTMHRAIAGIRSVIDGSSFLGNLVLSILDGDVSVDPAEYARIHARLRAQAAEIRAKLEAEYDAEQKKQ